MSAPLDKEIIRAIAEYYTEFGLTWPEPIEIVEQLGRPVDGLTAIIDRLLSEGKVAYDCIGSSRRVCILLDPAKFGWHGDYANVKALGRWLNDSQAFTGDDLQRYYEDPRRWSEQWAVYLVLAEAKAESERAA